MRQSWLFMAVLMYYRRDLANRGILYFQTDKYEISIDPVLVASLIFALQFCHTSALRQILQEFLSCGAHNSVPLD